MSILLSPNVVLGNLDADNPRIYYHNVITAASLSALEQSPTEPATNVANPATYLKWRGLTVAAQYLAITLPSVAAVDYIAIAGHNLGSIRATVTFQSSFDGITWNALNFGSMPSDDSVIILEFPEQAARYWRISIGPATAAPPAIGAVYLGRKLVMQRGIYVGHTPITLGRSSVVSGGRSESGQFLGRVLRRETLATQVDMHHITPAWYRANMPAFVAAAMVAPFFWAWRPTSYPGEAGFAWATGDVSVSNEMSNGMMQFAFAMQGIA